jgi:hypothetical protein
MALYRVEFSNDWIMGRWGFTDAALSRLKGRVTEPSRLENAWVVDFPGSPAALGDLLSARLNIQASDYARCGTIFEITILSGSPAAMPRRPRSRQPAAPPPWERQS